MRNLQESHFTWVFTERPEWTRGTMGGEKIRKELEGDKGRGAGKWKGEGEKTLENPQTGICIGLPQK